MKSHTFSVNVTFCIYLQKSKVWDYGQSMNKIVDYMMAGKPVVASYSGYPSMLNEAGSGILFKQIRQKQLLLK